MPPCCKGTHTLFCCELHFILNIQSSDKQRRLLFLNKLLFLNLVHGVIYALVRVKSVHNKQTLSLGHYF